MSNRIAEVGPEQAWESARIIWQAFLTVADEFGFTPENNPSNGAFIQPEKLLEDNKRGIRQFGLFRGEQQVGFMALENKDGRLYYLEKLAVLPEHRHQGYGKQLMDFARGWVKQEGGEEISIAIIDQNTRLKRWYEGYGFVQTGLKQFDHLPFTVCFLSMGV